MVGPVRIAAAGAVAAHDIKRAFDPLPQELVEVVRRRLEWSRVWTEGAAAGLHESLRRSRENPRPDLGPPDLPAMLAELVASLAETYAALRVARREIRRADLSEYAEPVVGRYGEIAAQVAEWARTATEMQRRIGDRQLRPGVRWGPDPDDPRVGAPVALALTTSFAIASALAAMATIDDNRLAGRPDTAVQPIFEIAAPALWCATELASGVAICLEHLLTHGHPWTEDPLDSKRRGIESAARHREALSLQLEDLDRYQPADASEARPGYVLMLERVDDDLCVLRNATDDDA